MDKENTNGLNGAVVMEDEVANYYEVLGVDVGASLKQIKNAFKLKAAVFHPDKNKSPGAVDRFAQCSEAYEVLSNPIHRGFYDMLVGVRPQTDKEIARLNGMKRDQARKELSCMEKTVTSIETEEEAREGLVIADAHYGDLRSQGKAAKINVRVPLQCMVDNSALIIKAGSSKKWLEGFWDPCPDTDKQLYVRYKFLNALHECLIMDEDELCIPLQEHLVEEIEAVEQHSSESGRNPSATQQDVERRAAIPEESQETTEVPPQPVCHTVQVEDTTKLVHPQRPKPSARRSTPKGLRKVAVPLTPGQNKLQTQVTFRQKRIQAKEHQRTKKRRRIFFASAMAFVLGLFFAKRRGYLDNVKIPGFGYVSRPLLNTDKAQQ